MLPTRPASRVGAAHRGALALLLCALAAAATLGARAASVAPAAGAADAGLPPPDDPALVHARKLLKGTILIDGHNDLPIAIRGFRKAPGDVVAYDLRQRTSGETDIPRLREGLVGGRRNPATKGRCRALADLRSRRIAT